MFGLQGFSWELLIPTNTAICSVLLQTEFCNTKLRISLRLGHSDILWASPEEQDNEPGKEKPGVSMSCKSSSVICVFGPK